MSTAMPIFSLAARHLAAWRQVRCLRIPEDLRRLPLPPYALTGDYLAEDPRCTYQPHLADAIAGESGIGAATAWRGCQACRAESHLGFSSPRGVIFNQAVAVQRAPRAG